MTDIVPVPTMPTVPLYPALGSANFNNEAYAYGSSMRGVSQWQNAIGSSCYTNALVAQERATVAADASSTAVTAKDITVAAKDVTVSARDTAVASANTASNAAATATAGAITATEQANRAQDIADNLAAGPVTSFNGRGGIVTLESADVSGALGFTPAATATTLAGYGITDGQKKLTQAYSDSTSNGVELAVNTGYALNADATYTRSLPSAPNIGDRIVLNNFENTWSSGLFTLQRGNPSHKINNHADDVVFNTNMVRRAELTYIQTNYWLLTFS